MKVAAIVVLWAALLLAIGIYFLITSIAYAGGSAPLFWQHPPQYIDRSLCENRDHMPRYCLPPPPRPRYISVEPENPATILMGAVSTFYNNVTAVNSSSNNSISFGGSSHAGGHTTNEGDQVSNTVTNVFRSNNVFNKYVVVKCDKCLGVDKPPVLPAPIPLPSSGWLMLGLLLPCLGGAAIYQRRKI